MEVEGKKVLIVGVARSGLAAARLLASRGAMVTANDMKAEADLMQSPLRAEIEELRKVGVQFVFGSHPENMFLNADLVVLSPGVPVTIAPLQSAKQAGVEIISEPELAGRFLRGRMIGITGSNGKTTTTTLIGELMQAAGAEVIVGGNIGTPLTSLVEKSTDKTWTIAELSSFQLEMIDTLRVHVAVVTYITSDHLGRHGSFKNYVRAKHRIFLSQKSDDWAVLNGLDQATADMIKRLGVSSRIVRFSSGGAESPNGPADLYIKSGSIWTTLMSDSSAEVEVIALSRIPLPGMHNVENVMTALARSEEHTSELQSLRQS